MQERVIVCSRRSYYAIDEAAWYNALLDPNTIIVESFQDIPFQPFHLISQPAITESMVPNMKCR